MKEAARDDLRMRLGIAGLGTAAASVIPEVLRHPGYRLAAAAEPRAGARERFTAQFGLPAYEDVEALCADPSVDVVYVATPNNLHAPYSIVAAEHGKQVIVEKPMALDLESSQAMIDAAERNGVRLLAGHTHSFDAPLRAMLDAVESGVIGAVQMVNQWYFTDWMFRGRMPEELDPASGGGVVYRQGPHAVDIVRMLAGGMVRWVRAITHAGRGGIEGSFMALLGFANDTGATIVYSGNAHFDSSELTFGIGEDGMPRNPRAHLDARRRIAGFRPEEEWDYKSSMRYGGATEGQWLADGRLDGERSHPFFGITVVSGERGDIRQTPRGLVIHGDEGPREVEVPQAALEREAELNIMYDAWVAGEPLASHDGRWGQATLEVCLAILESARTGREVWPSRQVSWREARTLRPADRPAGGLRSEGPRSNTELHEAEAPDRS